eukprot:502445_1
MKSPVKSVTYKRSRTALTLSNADRQSEIDHEPDDACNLVKICMFFMGISTMLAESMLLSIGTYYRQEYPNYPHLVYFVLPAYAVPNMLFLVLMIEHGSKIKFSIKVIIAFFIQSIILVLIPKRNELLDAKYIIICYAIIGMNTAIVNCSILGFMNLLNSNYQQITISAQAFAGIIASILRIITRYLYPSNINGIQNSTQIFFYFGAVFYLISIFVCIHLIFNKYIQYQKNVFAISITAYFRSIQQDINIDNFGDKHNKIKYINENNSLNSVNSQPLTLKESESLPMDTIDTSILSSYKQMSNSTTKMSSTKIKKNAINAKQIECNYKPLKSDNKYNHLTLTHLAALQKQKNACKSLTLFATNQGTIYVTDAVLNLIYSTQKKKKRSSINVSSMNVSKSSIKMFTKIGFLSIANKLYPNLYAFCHGIFFLNLLTWAVFPGLISGEIKSEFSYISDNNWMSILLSTEYFVCNFIGRILSSETFCNCMFRFCCKYDRESYKGYVIVSCLLCCQNEYFIINAKKLTLFTVIRIIMIYPIFVLLYIGYFHNFNLNWISHILMAILGLTHGYIYCVIYMCAPQFCPQHYREAAVSILRFFHFSGVLIGSSLALCISFLAN